jgi:polysaccharide biosynthesis/export protein
VADFRSQRVFVVGAVTRPGAVPLTGRLTLLEALDAVGGAATNAGTEISVLRAASPAADLNGPLLSGQQGVSEVSRVGLLELQDGRVRENVALQNGDTIVVPKGQEVYILGQIKKPGAIDFTQNMTVFRALSLSGGVTEVGSSNGVRIIRIIDGKKTEIKAKPTDVLKPGDTIVVPTRWF